MENIIKKNIFLYRIFVLVFCFTSLESFSQVDSITILTFDFNNHKIKENDDKISTKPVGVSLVEDRFGNEQSAVYLHGQSNSYLNLGTSKLLKPKNGTISLWVKLERKVYAGKGYESNPIIITKNSKADDFSDAYVLFYDFKSDRLMVFSSKDSTEQAGVNSIETFVFNKWHHLLFTYDDTQLSFYINGKLQLKTQKRFETHFDEADSVVIGNSANFKNDRYARGSIDDIQIFHKILTDEEIKKLYEAPNPNKLKNIMMEVGKYTFIIIVFLVVLFIIIILNKRKLKRQKEYFELQNKINELEIKVIKGQINPHFISNCLAAIQNLVLQNQPDVAGQYIAKFNHLMRKVLSVSDKTFIYLSEEIEIIKLNLELEQLRFKHEFQYKISIDENIDTDEFLVPSLITQPIIENAIWHGLLPIKGKRETLLNIQIFLENNFLIIEIIDNGVGRGIYKENNQSKGKACL
ncbi:MAG: histidine kinase [Bacteroidetes bacterium]|nr:histidine kinase [Bacteroidota bacterium]